VTAPRTIGPVTSAATAGAAAGTVLVWIVEAVAHVDIPAPVELAVAVLLTALGGFLVKPREAGTGGG
jgi:hypothetical protein